MREKEERKRWGEREDERHSKHFRWASVECPSNVHCDFAVLHMSLWCPTTPMPRALPDPLALVGPGGRWVRPWDWWPKRKDEGRFGGGIDSPAQKLRRGSFFAPLSPTLDPVLSKNPFFLCSGLWAARSQVNNSVITIVQTIHPRWL